MQLKSIRKTMKTNENYWHPMPFLTNSSPQTHYPNNTILLQATSQIDHKIIEDYLNNLYICMCGYHWKQNHGTPMPSITKSFTNSLHQDHHHTQTPHTITTHTNITQSKNTQTQKTCSIKWHKSDFRQAAQSQCKHMSKHSLKDNTQTFFLFYEKFTIF